MFKPAPGVSDGKIMIPSPNPRATKRKSDAVTTQAKRKVKKGGMMAPLPIDDRIYRTMPITEKQLRSIKNMYGIKK